MDELPEGDSGVTSLEALINAAISKGRGRWSADQLNFLVKVLEAYVQNIQVLQKVCKEISVELNERDRLLTDRENKIRELEQRLRAHQNLAAWQERLREKEAELNAQRSEFEGATIGRIRECLKRVAEWERGASGAFHSTSLSF